MDEAAVFPYPTEAGLRCVISFQNGVGVRKWVSCQGGVFVAKVGQPLLEFLPLGVVIVEGMGGVGRHRLRLGGWGRVGEAHHDHGLGVGKYSLHALSEVSSLVSQISHFSVVVL
jgi:hypothetical protein